MMMPGLLLLFTFLLASASSIVKADGCKELVVTEEAYRSWVKQMGSSKHPVFQRAKNKLKPCMTIQVHKDRRFGDFASVQKAIDSLPMVNLCRVVISIGAGIYR